MATNTERILFHSKTRPVGPPPPTQILVILYRRTDFTASTENVPVASTLYWKRPCRVDTSLNASLLFRHGTESVPVGSQLHWKCLLRPYCTERVHVGLTLDWRRPCCVDTTRNVSIAFTLHRTRPCCIDTALKAPLLCPHCTEHVPIAPSLHWMRLYWVHTALKSSLLHRCVAILERYGNASSWW